MDPEWTSNGGGNVLGDQLTGSGGALASLPHAKIQPTRNQKPEDERIQRSTRGDEAGEQERHREM